MTNKLKLKFKVRCSKESYVKLTKDLEDYIDELSLTDPGDGEEILEILAKHGVEIEHGNLRVNFMLCGKCGGVLYKTKPDISVSLGWILKCSECGNKFYPPEMEFMDKKQIKELVKEEQVLNNFEFETTGHDELIKFQDSDYVCGPEGTGSIKRDKEKLRK